MLIYRSKLLGRLTATYVAKICPSACVTIQLYRRAREVKAVKARNIYAAFPPPHIARAFNLYVTNRAISASTSEFHH